MDVSPTPSPPPPSPAAPARPRRPLLFWLLLALFVLLLLIGLGSLTAYVVLSRQQPSLSPHTPILDQMPTRQISAGLAVWSLTDIAPSEVYRQATSGQEWDTATLIAVGTPDLPPVQRLGWLTVLARQQATTGNQAEAGVLNELAGDLLVLEPTLSDWQRLQALQQVADVWLMLGDNERGRLALAQWRFALQNSPDLPLTVRRQSQLALADRYQALHDAKEARAVAAVDLSPTAVVTPTLSPPDPFLWLQAALPPDENVTRFHDARVRAAQDFVDAWISAQGHVPAGQVQALAAALLDEDIARRAYFERYLAEESLSDEMRLALLWQQAQWLARKHQVAAGLLGQPLIANWQAELPAIRQRTHDSFARLVEEMLAYTGSLPAEEQTSARAAVARQALIWGRLGLYPDADLGVYVDSLQQSMADLAPEAGLWPHVWLDENGALQVSWQAQE